MAPKNFNIGVKAIIIDQDRVLLLRKVSGERIFWDAPGGRMHEGETMEQSLSRELREELPSAENISIDQQLNTWVLDRNITEQTGLCLVFYAVTASFSGDVKISEEHDRAAWVSFEELPSIASEGIAEAVRLARGQSHRDKNKE